LQCMKKYFVKTPWWLKKIYPGYVWSIDTKEKVIYLTFDDGPHPSITPFVLDELKKYDARASFFCIGKNVAAWPAIYQRILAEGHAAGNHTQTHRNGWQTKNDIYLADIAEAAGYINSALFRPPYGRISVSQARKVPGAIKNEAAKIIMWDVLSGDFDESLSPQECFENVTRRAGNGSIIVFHDSEKAFPRLQHCLPRVLAFFAQKGMRFEKLGAGL